MVSLKSLCLQWQGQWNKLPSKEGTLHTYSSGLLWWCRHVLSRHVLSKTSSSYWKRSPNFSFETLLQDVDFGVRAQVIVKLYTVWEWVYGEMKTKRQGQNNGLAGKHLATETWWSEFDPWIPWGNESSHSRKLVSDLHTSTMAWEWPHLHTSYTHTQAHTHNGK